MNLFFFSIFFSLFHSIYSQNILNNNDNYYQDRFVKDFNFIDEQLRYFTIRFILPIFDELVPKTNISQKCLKTIETFLKNPNREWAAKMIDSSGRIIPSGFLAGTLTDYGDYDQCMSIKNIHDTNLGLISGQYCWLTYRPPLVPLNINVNFSGTEYESTWTEKLFSTPRSRLYYRISSGLCLPISCNSYEIEEILHAFFDEKIHLNDLIVSSCQSSLSNNKQMDFAQMASITIILFLIICVIIGTLVDSSSGYCEKNISSKVEFWKSFSLLKNTSNIFLIKEKSYQNSSQNIELTPIHGLRVLLILWVITCHTTNFAPIAFYDQPMIASRFVDDLQIVRNFWSQFVISGSLSVQGFFIISGLISLHTSLQNSEAFLKNVSYWHYIFFRWIRFVPPLIGMLCFQFLWPYFSTGPLIHWDFLKFGHEPCYNRAWANFLFFSNNYILTDQCGSHTWFLSADFQINLFAYFLILIYVKNYRTGLKINLFALIISFILPTLIHWIYNVPLVHILETDFDKLNMTFSMVEFYFFNHCSAYFSGMLIAALLNLRTKKTLKKHIRRIFWWTSIGIIIALPFSTYPFIQMENIPTNLLSLSYTGIKRLLWNSSISWIIFASSSFSKNTIIARFLSAKFFQPFSKLTFCIYLVQSIVVWIYAYTSRSLHSIAHFNTIFRIGGVILYSLVAAFILYILFEAPSVNLVKLFFKSQTKKDTEDINEDNNSEEREMIQNTKDKFLNDQQKNNQF